MELLQKNRFATPRLALDRLREILREYGSASALAQKAGVGCGAISHLLYGKRGAKGDEDEQVRACIPKPGTFRRLLSNLDLRPDQRQEAFDCYVAVAFMDRATDQRGATESKTVVRTADLPPSGSTGPGDVSLGHFEDELLRSLGVDPANILTSPATDTESACAMITQAGHGQSHPRRWEFVDQVLRAVKAGHCIFRVKSRGETDGDCSRALYYECFSSPDMLISFCVATRLAGSSTRLAGSSRRCFLSQWHRHAEGFWQATFSLNASLDVDQRRKPPGNTTSAVTTTAIQACEYKIIAPRVWHRVVAKTVSATSLNIIVREQSPLASGLVQIYKDQVSQ